MNTLRGPICSCAEADQRTNGEARPVRGSLVLRSLPSACGDFARGYPRRTKLTTGTAVAAMTSMQPSQPPQDTPGLEGPDYLALVIEWDDDVPTLVRPTAPDRALSTGHQIITVLSALVALVFATWGIRRLRLAK